MSPAYEIKDVPTRVDLQIIAWHEKDGWVTEGLAKGEPMKLKEGDNTRDFKVKVK